MGVQVFYFGRLAPFTVACTLALRAFKAVSAQAAGFAAMSHQFWMLNFAGVAVVVAVRQAWGLMNSQKANKKLV